MFLAVSVGEQAAAQPEEGCDAMEMLSLGRMKREGIQNESLEPNYKSFSGTELDS